MKNRFLTSISVVALTLLSVTACTEKNENDSKFYTATCTFKPVSKDHYYIKVDEKTAVVPINPSLKKYPWVDMKEKRAFISYTTREEHVDPVPGFDETIGVYVQSIDTIRVKNPVVYKAEDAENYGTDPLGIFLGEEVFPRTCVEDGYLSVVFEMPYFTENGPRHEINLISGANPEDPYEVMLVHNANNNMGPFSTVHMCDFRLENLPSTHGKTVTLTLKWKSMVTGKVESVKFDYCSREDWS